MARQKKAAAPTKDKQMVRSQIPGEGSRVESDGKPCTWLPPVVFALLAFLIYIDVLFDSALAPAWLHSDLSFQFLAWREFGFSQMASGNLPLWNPHIFAGTPYLASFQSALFYPPNWLHLFLPLGLAISWSYALHTFLMGFTMSLWARHRGAGVAGQILAGIMMMFGGQFFLHGFAGHLPHLGVMVWTPLIFLATDALADGKDWRWVMVGAGALALQILAGHPQYVYYTALMVGTYALLRLRRANLRRLLPGMAAFYLLGAALAAVQLVPGIEASGENIRTAGLPYAMASEFSFSVVQGLTMVAPYVFGNHTGNALAPMYLGTGYLWEMCLFVSITGLALAGLGFTWLPREHKIAAGGMLVLTMGLALGRHLPVHQVLHRCLPYFSSFRAPAKFAFFTSMFLALLAAEGLGALARNQRPRARMILERVLLVSGGVLLASFLLTLLWGAFVQAVSSYLAGAGDHFILQHDDYAQPAVRAALRRTMAVALAVAAVTALIAGLLVRCRRTHLAVGSLVALAATEMLAFAVAGRSSMVAKVQYPDEFARQIVGREPYRTLHPGTTTNLRLLNAAMARGTHEMWGYDPGLLLRYGQLMAASQDADPEQATQILRFKSMAAMDGLYRMFRLKWLCLTKPEMRVVVQPRPMEQVELMGQYQVAPDRTSMFAKLLDPSFDPKSMVFLEQEPAITPAGSPAQGEAKVVWQDTDTLEIRARVDRAALLLVTDNYAKGWRVQALADSSQREYQLLPANYVLRAVPLASGVHHLRMVYRPTGWVVGAWISLVALLGVLVALFILRARRLRRTATLA